MKQLYRVISVLSNFPYGGKRNEESIVYWTYSNRAKPLVAYDLAIENYQGTLGTDHKLQEQAVDELFSRREAMALKAYLNEKYNRDDDVSQDECIVQEVKLPIRADTLPISALGCGALELNSRKKRNSLPFKVSGHYRVYPSRSSKSIHDSAYEMMGGTQYIRSALKHLKVKRAFTDDQISDVVATISGEGWVVQSGQSRAQLDAMLQERLKAEEERRRRVERRQVLFSALECQGYSLQDISQAFGKEFARDEKNVIREFPPASKLDELPF